MSQQTQFFTSQEHFYEFKAAWANAVNSPEAKKTYLPCDEYRYDIKKGTFIEGWEPYGSGGYVHVSKGTGTEVFKGWVKAEHTILYNILRGKPLHTGFNAVSNPKKRNRWTSDMNMFYLAVIGLENRVTWAKDLIEDDNAMEKFRKENGVITVVEKLNLFLKGVNENIDLVENERFIALVNKIRTYSKKPKEILSAGSREFKERKLNEFLEPFNGTLTLEMLVKVDAKQLKTIQLFNRQQTDNYWLKSR